MIGISAKNDGTNTSVSLVAEAGASVTSVLFQYQVTGAPGVWISAAAAVARGADGVFSTEWIVDPPADVTDIRAVPTRSFERHLGHRCHHQPRRGGATPSSSASEGTLGVFQEPYTEGRRRDHVRPRRRHRHRLAGRRGSDRRRASPAGTAGTDVTRRSRRTTTTTSDTFNSVRRHRRLHLLRLAPSRTRSRSARTTSNTDDVEALDLYVQTIGSITATPETQDQVDPGPTPWSPSPSTTPPDRPVAGAQVAVGDDTDTDGADPDTDTDGAETLLGYTDGRGVSTSTRRRPTAGTFTYYVNTTDDDGYEAGVDKADTATVTDLHRRR